MININCPKCGSDKLLDSDNNSGSVCLDCGYFISHAECRKILKKKIDRIKKEVPDSEYDIGER